MLLVGTDSGLVDVASRRTPVEGAAVTWIATAGDTAWALLERRRVVRVEGSTVTEVASLPDADGQSLAFLPDGSLVAGRTGARLARLGDRGWDPLAAFEKVPGRRTWENPAAPTPDSRSMAVDPAGTLWVNVHVGGVWRSADAGASWTSAIEPEADVHEVTAGDGGRLAVAAAIGFGWSEDAGATWQWTDRGLHATYARAVALDGDVAFVSASTGPGTRRGAVYRARVGEAFERCAKGLPEWFEANVDTAHLSARGGRAAIGGPDGVVYVSEDGGATWDAAGGDLGRIAAVRFA